MRVPAPGQRLSLPRAAVIPMTAPMPAPAVMGGLGPRRVTQPRTGDAERVPCVRRCLCVRVPCGHIHCCLTIPGYGHVCTHASRGVIRSVSVGFRSSVSGLCETSFDAEKCRRAYYFIIPLVGRLSIAAPTAVFRGPGEFGVPSTPLKKLFGSPSLCPLAAGGGAVSRSRDEHELLEPHTTEICDIVRESLFYGLLHIRASHHDDTS